MEKYACLVKLNQLKTRCESEQRTTPLENGLDGILTCPGPDLSAWITFSEIHTDECVSMWAGEECPPIISLIKYHGHPPFHFFLLCLN